MFLPCMASIWHGAAHLVDGERRSGLRDLIDVSDTALRGLALCDGEDLHGGVDGAQMEVGESGLFQVVEIPLG